MNNIDDILYGSSEKEEFLKDENDVEDFLDFEEFYNLEEDDTDEPEELEFHE